MASTTTTLEQDEPKRGWLRHLPKALAAAGVLLAGSLIYLGLQRYSVAEIRESMAAIPATSLARAMAAACASYVCLTFFDYLALRYVDRPLPYRRAALASFCSLSLGHNIGFAGLSSGAIRYRFYSKWGLSAGDIVKLVLFAGSPSGSACSALERSAC